METSTERNCPRPELHRRASRSRATRTRATTRSAGSSIRFRPSVRIPDARRSRSGDGVGTKFQYNDVEILGASPDLRWRYALASTLANEYFQYGDARTFYAAEAATYGLSLQTRGQYSVETNVHYSATPKDDVSILALLGQAEYNQFGSPYPGETIGALDGATTVYPGETNPNAPVNFASGVRGNYDIFKAQWQHTGAHVFSRLQAYQSQYVSSSGGAVLGRKRVSGRVDFTIRNIVEPAKRVESR